MESTKKEVVTSHLFDFIDLPSIHQYGTETFGIRLADSFIAEIYSNLNTLSQEYLLHPECHHLETKTKNYRNIVIGSYLIIYRITEDRIEVLRAFHGSHSPKKIIKTKKIIINYK